jgi:hypothetical protein
MYAVGSFNEIEWHGAVYHRNNAFSFSATAPYAVSSWRPNVNGQVNSIALHSNCSIAYLGGQFSSVDGVSAHNLAAVKSSTGSLISSFGHQASAKVETLHMFGTHLIVGGFFTNINGSTATPYLASVNPASGRDDGFVNLHISGHYQYCLGSRCVARNVTNVYNQQFGPSGYLDLVEGDFTSVGGQPRQQMFMVSLKGARASVTGWRAPIFDDHCGFGHPIYVKSAAWSPNGSTVYTGTTGLHLYNWNHRFPLTGPCDAAIAFPATQTTVSPKWVNYTGCYSLYSAAADSTTAYFGGHELYSENPDGCKSQGPGAIKAPGIEGLAPSNGALIWNPTRGRGHGADDMLVTPAGLWVASDDFQNTNMCGGYRNHAGICFFPG